MPAVTNGPQSGNQPPEVGANRVLALGGEKKAAMFFPMPEPRALRENAHLAYPGESAWLPSLLNNFQAESFLLQPNPSGRANEEVLRRFRGWAAGQPRARWQIDFPPHLSEAEALLYAGPATFLRARLERHASSPAWWVNPHRSDPLRVALARVDRYLTTVQPGARQTTAPAWTWTESDFLPDESLLAVARDDDFTHGILQSREFSVWWRTFARPDAPTFAVESFPFPWSPRIPLGSLTALQQELRYDVSRAARQENSTQLGPAASTAYGWPHALDDEEMLARLLVLNERRAY